MENTAAYRSEQHYLEEWYVLEDRLKHYIDDIVRFTPTITYDGRRQAAEELARLISLVEHVKVNGLQLAAEFQIVSPFANSVVAILTEIID